MDDKINTLATKEEIKSLTTKAELNVEQDEIIKFETHDLSYFLGKTFFGNDGSQNMFFYQHSFIILESLVNKNNEHVISWKSKGLHKSELF